MTLIPRYLSLTFLYGSIHTGLNAKSHTKYINHQTGDVTLQPILASHQLTRIVLGGCMGPSVWPIMLYDDATTAECRLTGRDQVHYGKMLDLFH
jgi:hypothetical protein